VPPPSKTRSPTESVSDRELNPACPLQARSDRAPAHSGLNLLRRSKTEKVSSQTATDRFPGLLGCVRERKAFRQVIRSTLAPHARRSEGVHASVSSRPAFPSISVTEDLTRAT